MSCRCCTRFCGSLRNHCRIGTALTGGPRSCDPWATGQRACRATRESRLDGRWGAEGSRLKESMCRLMCMRLHISLEDELVAELDALVGPGKRSAFITASVRKALDEARRWDGILESLGSLSGGGDEWGDDPEAWVERERRSDPDRVG